MTADDFEQTARPLAANGFRARTRRGRALAFWEQAAPGRLLGPFEPPLGVRERNAQGRQTGGLLKARTNWMLTVSHRAPPPRLFR